MSAAVRVAVVGDFNPDFHSHHATNAGLRHAAAALRVDLQLDWLPTPSLLAAAADDRLGAYDAVLLAPGSPYRSEAGALAAVRWARERDWAFFGT